MGDELIIELLEYADGAVDVCFKHSNGSQKAFRTTPAEVLRVMELYFKPEPTLSEAVADAVNSSSFAEGSRFPTKGKGEPVLIATDTKEEYLSHYQRLAKEFHNRPRVVVEFQDSATLGQLQVLDLRQDSGYGAGVMLDQTGDGERYKYFMQRAEYVHLFSKFEDQFMQLARGPVWDGNLISKAQRKTLVKLGLVQQVHGWNILTEAGVREGIKANWLRA